MNPSKQRKQNQRSYSRDEVSHLNITNNDFSRRDSAASFEEPMSRDESIKENEDIIKVYVRVKPETPSEMNPRDCPISDSTLKFKNSSVHVLNSASQISKTFSYEHIFNEKSKQEEVFMVSTAPLIKHAIMGYNSTVFVYGQTGTGIDF